MSAEPADLNFAAPIKSVSVENMVHLRQVMIERLAAARAAVIEAHKIACRGHLGVPRIEASVPEWACTGSIMGARAILCRVDACVITPRTCRAAAL